MKNTIKFIYFDIDDTILDHKSAERSALQETRNSLSALQDVAIEELWKHYHQNNKRLWIEYGAGRISREILENNRFEWTLRDLGQNIGEAEKMRQVYMKFYEQHWTWVSNAKEVLTILSAQYPVGFLTNGFAEVQRAKAQQFNLDTLSEFYIISEEVGFMKPSPGIFEYATRAVKCNPEEILYVGDSFISDIQGGSSYGWKTAWFTYLPNPSEAKIADIVFDDFRLLPDLVAKLANK